MKFVLLLSLIVTALCVGERVEEAVPAGKNGNDSTGTGLLESADEPERNLAQILVEEEKAVKTKAAHSIKEKKKPANKNVIYLKRIDGMIKDFGLDQKLEKKKVKAYFRKLESKIYNSLKRSLYKQRKYMQSYEGVIRHYKDVAEKLNIK
jgi:hypothetical protein